MESHNYIAVEGVDGCGSTLISKALADTLTEKGFDVLWVHEPSSGPIGLTIRKVLADGIDLAPTALLYLFLADRADLQRTVRAHLAKAETSVVVSDRCYWSSLVYQQDHYNMAYLKAVHDTPNLLVPSHILFLDVLADIAVKRALRRTGKVVEIFDTADHIHKNAARYRALAMHNHSCVIGHIKADVSPTEVLSACLLWLQSAWSLHGTHSDIARAGTFVNIPPSVFRRLSSAT